MKLQTTARIRIALPFGLAGREVMIDRLSDPAEPSALAAKAQIESSARSLAAAMRPKGEGEREIGRVLMAVVGNERFDFPSLCDFLDTSLLFAEKLDRPAKWIGLIAAHVAAEGSGLRRSLRAYELFREAASAQGTEREEILVKSLGQ